VDVDRRSCPCDPEQLTGGPTSSYRQRPAPGPAPGAVVSGPNPDPIRPCSACPWREITRIGLAADGLNGPPRQSERPPPGRPTDRRDRQTTDGKEWT
jgi:hypothetical protein